MPKVRKDKKKAGAVPVKQGKNDRKLDPDHAHHIRVYSSLFFTL